MRKLATAACFASLLCGFSHAQELKIHPFTGTQPIMFDGAESSRQFIVMQGKNDRTCEVSYAVQPEGILGISKEGYALPKKNGKATLTATLGENAKVTVPIEVKNVEKERAISFPNDVVPVFTRNHCNAGACHAKSTGQNGFRLSLLGYEPESDYENIVNQGRGRRVNEGAPEFSLLLMKASGDLPHGGGARLPNDSLAYQQLAKWIRAGMPYRADNDPDVEKIDVFPGEVITQPGGHQQLSVTATFTNGEVRDITRMAQFEPNDPAMAEVNDTGLVSLLDKNGTTSILVRFQEHIATFSATMPLKAEKPKVPAPANFIDKHIFSQLSLMRVAPSDPIDDHTFLRRVTLDIAGRLPSLEETRAFMANNEPEKRSKKIDELLDSTDYADFFAGKWAGILRNKVDRGRPWVERDSHAFHAWIRTNLIQNRPFDEFAADLIVASGRAIDNPAVNWYRVVEDQKDRMQDIAQVFLGLRMQCAQCHHHPYEQWSQDDYYSFTAFFSTIETKNIPKLPEEDIYFHNRKPAQMKNPFSGEVLKPRLLGQSEPLDIPADRDPRFELVNWMRSKDNPYFARILVNRYWKHFFSRGLVEPEDDIRPTNPATHPELLDDLATSFLESDFDLKQLIRTICNSETYQLSTIPKGNNAEDEQNYARYYPKRLAAEVLLDSLNDITGSSNSFSNQPKAVRAIALPNEKATAQSEFLMMFGRPAMDTACECERTSEANLGQSLHLLNSDTVQQKLTSNTGLAATLAKATDRSDGERLQELYLRAFSRKPAKEELQMALAHLAKKRKASVANPKELPAAQAEKEAFEDIIWVLSNTKEFMFNH